MLHIVTKSLLVNCHVLLDGTESSHMHSRDEENYQTGYEWMLMVEAKKVGRSRFDYRDHMKILMLNYCS